MPRVLLINANTTRSVTDLIEHHARAATGGAVEFRAATAAFGAPYVASEAACVIAAHAALDCLERHAEGCDAVLLACFGDPGLFALRERAQVPVLGMAEACMAEASRQGPFAIVTGGLAWTPMLERLAGALGHAARLTGVHAAPLAGPELALNEPLLLELVEAAARGGARSVIVGGAALAGFAARLQPRAPLPLIDGVACAARAAAELARARRAAPRPGMAA